MRGRKVIRGMVSMLYALAVTSMIGAWAVKYAFMERGYMAIGGEYLFIPLVAWGAYEVMDIFLNELEGGSIWKEQ